MYIQKAGSSSLSLLASFREQQRSELLQNLKSCVFVTVPCTCSSWTSCTRCTREQLASTAPGRRSSDTWRQRPGKSQRIPEHCGPTAGALCYRVKPSPGDESEQRHFQSNGRKVEEPRTNCRKQALKKPGSVVIEKELGSDLEKHL